MPDPKAEIQARTVEQLSALRAMRTLDRFTMGKLAAVAGVRAATIRCMLLRWKDEGLPLLEEVDVEHRGGAGQPPKVYVLAAAMHPIVEASIKAADHQFPPRADDDAIEPIERMNLLDVAMEMIGGAEQTTDSERRDKLVAEARRLLGRSRETLRRRAADVGARASGALERDLRDTEQRIARFEPAGLRERLRFNIAERATELRRRAAQDPPQEGAQDSFRWLSEFALHYVETAPSGRDAEVGFFGGFLFARGEMGVTQDTVLDQWLFSVPARRDRRNPTPTGLCREALQEKFSIAFGRMVECGCRDDPWYPLLQGCLEGIARNALLAVIPGIHEHVGRLMRETPSGALRLASREFLQRYSLDRSIMTPQDVAPADDRDASDLVASFCESFARQAA